MLESISPYALLTASKPRRPAAVVTAYDLYSQAQCGANESIAHQHAIPEKPAASVPADIPAPMRRTHYIADIQSRHNAAICRAPQRTCPLT